MNTFSQRSEVRTTVGRFRGGKLAPAMSVALKGRESCILKQTAIFELDGLAGRLITPVTAQMVQVMVPVQAIRKLKYPATQYAGSDDVIRDLLLSGAVLFDLENENEISKRLDVTPRSVGGVKKVNEVNRLAYICAINHLRRLKYVDAVQLLATSMNVAPALISKNVLQRLNGVLDPEDRVNGAVSLDFGTIKLPVEGFGIKTLAGGGAVTLNETGNKAVAYPGSVAGTNLSAGMRAGSSYPDIYANMSGVDTGISLTDFYNAERMDELVRQMRAMVDANPELGPDMVARWVHGLSLDIGGVPRVLSDREIQFGKVVQRATDKTGLLDDTMRSDYVTQITTTVPVPATEFGCVVVTLLAVKPDEVLASQPHPILSDVWTADNFVADELSRDPVPVKMRELFADVAVGSEGTIAFYTGLNQLKRSYASYGFNRHLDKNTVANKTAVWQIEIPLSVTPSSVIYPETLSHYPFMDQAAEVCTYTLIGSQVVQTPMVFGPTPVEELAIIETADLFNEVP